MGAVASWGALQAQFRRKLSGTHACSIMPAPKIALSGPDVYERTVNQRIVCR